MPPTPAKIEGPLHPTPKDYPAFLKFLSQCYGFPDPKWFENDTEVFFGAQAPKLKTKWALKIGGRFAAHIGVFPFTALVEGRPLKVAGIGAVATHPDFRGQGLMKRLMDHVERQIEKDGYDLCILWGERALYSPYGYERGLFTDQFTFLKRNLKYFAVPRGLRPAGPGDLPSLRKLHNHHRFRIEKGPAYFSSVIRRFRQGLPESAWVLEEKGKLPAYAIFGKHPGGNLEAAEWGGAAEDVACLWASVLQRHPAEFLTASLYPGCGLYDWALENCFNQVRTTQSCMLKPLNLSRILRAFEPQLKERYRNSGLKARKTFNLQVENDQTVGIKLGTGLKVGPPVSKGVSIALSDSEAVRILFGVGRPSTMIPGLPQEAHLLDGLFPLQWYWWRSDWI